MRPLPALVAGFILIGPAAGLPGAQKPSPGAGPIIVLETAKGIVELETYPEEAPKTVAHIVALVNAGFYDGLRFHRVEPAFVVQVGDPQTRDPALRDRWGRGGSGKAIGVAEMSKKRRHLRGAVGVGHPGDPKLADSQVYILLDDRPGLDGAYTVFGRVLRGMDVVDRLERADVVRKATVRAATEAP